MAKLLNRNNRMNNLMWATNQGKVSIIQSLINQGDADVNAVDLEGASALIFASMRGHSTTVQTLLNLGANIHAAKFDGLTALMYASMGGHIATIKILLACRANIHAVDKYGNTALIIAALHGQASSIEVLIDAGAQVDTPTQNGVTALMLASQNNHPAAVVALMAGDANITAVTQTGFTAMRLASQNHHESIVSIIKVGLECLQNTCRKRDEDVSLILKRLIAPVELRSYIISYDYCPSFEDIFPALGILKASVRRRRNFTHLAESLPSSSYPLTPIYSSPINFNNDAIETKEHKEEGQNVSMSIKNRVEHQLSHTEEAQMHATMVSSLSNFERTLSTFNSFTRDTKAMTFRVDGSSPQSNPRALLILSSNNPSGIVSTLATTSSSSSSSLPPTMNPRPSAETSIIAQKRKQQCIALSKRGL